jgi:hypothetical protein
MIEGGRGQKTAETLMILTRINLRRKCLGKPHQALKPPTSPWGSFEAPNDWFLEEHA